MTKHLTSKNGTVVSDKATQNFVEGTNVTLTVTDDGDSVNVQIDAAGGGGGSVATDAIWDVKGDLAGGTGANTAARLAVGADDTVLMADAAAATGLKWVAPTTTPAAIGTQAGGTGDTFTRGDHVHATGAGTPSTQAFGDAAATGTGPAASMTDHKHAMPAAAVTTSGLTQTTARILGRTTAATGAVEEITVGSGLSLAAGALTATGGAGSVATDTIFDAKGDLPAGTGADTAAKLTVGANGDTLIPDSSQSTGLRWGSRFLATARWSVD